MFIFVVVIKAVYTVHKLKLYTLSVFVRRRQQQATTSDNKLHERKVSVSVSPNVVVYSQNGNYYVRELLYLNCELVLHVRCTLQYCADEMKCKNLEMQ